MRGTTMTRLAGGCMWGCLCKVVLAYGSEARGAITLIALKFYQVAGVPDPREASDAAEVDMDQKTNVQSAATDIPGWK